MSGAPVRLCKRCKQDAYPPWKCCPTHTTEQGPDVVCVECARVLHPDEPTWFTAALAFGPLIPVTES